MTIVARNDGFSAQQGDGTIREAIPVFDAGLSAVGTGPTHLAKAEDAAHASGDVGIAMLFVRNDANISMTSTDQDYGTGSIDAQGRTIVKQFSSATSDWKYVAPASGLSNTTTAVTIKTSAGAGVKNYITGLQISSAALGAATEFAIRDGAAGTVIWRINLTTAGIVAPINIVFQTPISGSAATLLEIVTLTASITGAVYFNAQGYVGP